jgi:hypothetical protein
MRVLSVAGFCLVLSVSASMTAQAADSSDVRLYRYVDSRGVTVLDRQGVPPEYVGKGYQVLNSQGRVIQVVPPAPTAEQARQAEVEKAQADADAQLLHLYSSPEDVDRARARKLAEVDTLIGMAQGNVQSLAAQQRNLQGQAADHERAGHPVPQPLIDHLHDLRDQQQNLNVQIQRYQETRRQAEAEFAQDRARLVILLK